MLGKLRNSFAEINLTALEHNYHLIKHAFGGPLCPMVKADGYGHGDTQVARVFETLGARYLGVALIEEGIKLRQAGIQTPILTFSHFDSAGAEAIVRYRLTPIISQFDQIQKLKAVVHDEAHYAVHVKFNTGMQRLGFEPSEASKIAELFDESSFLKLEGLCTHFSKADDFHSEHSFTKEQIKTFLEAASVIKNKVQSKMILHYENSAAILSDVTPKLDLARPGLSLYGASPKLSPVQTKNNPKLQPVMSIKSFIGFIHSVKKGAPVSYGGTWQATRESLIAVIPIGYADGYPRVLSGKSDVLIKGFRCPQVGLVCMDYLMVDITLLKEKNISATLGDEVVLLGSQEKSQITVEELAELANTVPYEILTGLRPRLARVYIH
jgi:alanine racemase